MIPIAVLLKASKSMTHNEVPNEKPRGHRNAKLLSFKFIRHVAIIITTRMIICFYISSTMHFIK